MKEDYRLCEWELQKAGSIGTSIPFFLIPNQSFHFTISTDAVTTSGGIGDITWTNDAKWLQLRWSQIDLHNHIYDIQWYELSAIFTILHCIKELLTHKTLNSSVIINQSYEC